jgi:hypothetical protein
MRRGVVTVGVGIVVALVWYYLTKSVAVALPTLVLGTGISFTLRGERDSVAMRVLTCTLVGVLAAVVNLYRGR